MYEIYRLLVLQVKNSATASHIDINTNNQIFKVVFSTLVCTWLANKAEIAANIVVHASTAPFQLFC